MNYINGGQGMSKTFCKLPWIHLATHPHGGTTLCCVSDHTNGMSRSRNFFGETGIDWLELSKNTIDEMMNSDYFKTTRLEFMDGKIPKSCIRCFEEEKKGINSKRIEENNNYPNFTYEDAVNMTREDGTIETDLRFVELRLGNVCNVGCRSCNPASSTKLKKPFKILGKELDYVDDMANVTGFEWIDKEKFWDELFEKSDKLEVVYINGGEPTLIKKHWEYLNRLVESGLSKNIILWYSLNMTQIPPFAIDLWKQFKLVKISCSIDDLDERNKFLRYPTKWESVEESLKTVLKYDFIETSVCQTISFLNVWYLDEFYKYIKSFSDKYIHIHFNFVYDPTHLQPWNLPRHIIDDILDRCKNVMSADDYNIVKSQLDRKPNKEMLQRGIEFNERFDIIRKENVRETFKELFDALSTNKD